MRRHGRWLPCLMGICWACGSSTGPGPDAGPGPDPGSPADLPGETPPPPDPEFAIPHLPFPQHPFLAPDGTSNMHDDASMSDTYAWAGPEGPEGNVSLVRLADGMHTCTTLTFDRAGRILTVRASFLQYDLLALDPSTLAVLAEFPLPPRDPSDPLFPYDDTSGAAYFVLDHRERVILADAENAVQVLSLAPAGDSFRQEARFDLSGHVVAMEWPARDHVQMAIPDWQGLWWFTTRYGRVGTLREADGRARSIALPGEEIQNSFAVGEDGVFIVTSHALYRFLADPDGTPRAVWRTPYDRGSGRKPGNIHWGSGTTPQLFGEMVAITDNADPRMRVLFLRRSDGSIACQVPVFAEGRSTTENALIGWHRQGPRGLEYSVIVDDNYGIDRNAILGDGRCWTDHDGGQVRVDLLPDGNGGFTCAEVWAGTERSSQVLPKLSLRSGLLYLYTYERAGDGDYDFFVTAVDARTGATRHRWPAGHGLDFANFGQPMAISPDGTLYLGTMNGLLRATGRIH